MKKKKKKSANERLSLRDASEAALLRSVPDPRFLSTCPNGDRFYKRCTMVLNFARNACIATKPLDWYQGRYSFPRDGDYCSFPMQALGKVPSAAGGFEVHRHSKIQRTKKNVAPLEVHLEGLHGIGPHERIGRHWRLRCG